MSGSTMDTHAAVLRLVDAGIEQGQASAIVSTVRLAVEEGVATKADLSELKADLTTKIYVTTGVTIATFVAVFLALLQKL